MLNPRRLASGLMAVLLSASIYISSIVVPAANGAERVQVHLPETLKIGEDLEIRVSGLPPNAEAKIEAERRYGWTKLRDYRSIIYVQTDSNGEVNLSKQAPIEDSRSSYEGVQPIGLLWSMRPTGEQVPSSSGSRSALKISVSCDVDADDDIFEQFEFELADRSPMVKEYSFGDSGQLEGSFLMMEPSKKPLPVVIILGGSEGGDSAARSIAPVLASAGFAAVGFPYYAPAYGDKKAQFPSLPRAFVDIPIDRINLVLREIEKHPMLDEERVGLHGVSKGGEFVLAAASRIKKFKAVAAFVPSDVIWEGWGSNSGPKSSFSFNGEPLPFVPYKGMGETLKKLRNGETARMRDPHDAGREAFPERVADARIRAEDIEAALLIVGGDADDVWDSGGMCRNIVAARRSANLKTSAWISESAGHYLSGHAYHPMAFAPEDAKLRTQTFPAMIDFFCKHLEHSPR